MENNNRLSQDEIDALLKGGDDTAQEQPESGLSLMEQDTIGEIGNISFGSSATALSALVESKSRNYDTGCIGSQIRHVKRQLLPRPNVISPCQIHRGIRRLKLICDHDR